ncbi:MAG: DUF2029 domain-containing protein [Actinobacteria bacterium]|nr:DUF2029 domain-containing protein [Actinomycetota bacterium]
MTTTTTETAEPAAPSARAPLSRALLVLIGVLLLARVLALGLLLLSGQEQDESVIGGDARRYSQIATADGTPYADFAVEYPPVAYGLVRALAASDVQIYTLIRLGISQLVLDVGTALVLGWGWGRRTLVAYLLLGLPFLPFPYLYLRVDLLSVFLATLGLALLRRRHDRSGGALLALSIFAKLWPVALAPLLVLERRWKALVAWVVVMALGMAAWIAWAGPGGPIEVFSFRGAQGWQVESLPGIFLHMQASDRAHVEQGAWRTGVMPEWSRPVLTGLSVLFVVLAWWWAHRRRQEGANEHVAFALAPLAGVLSLLIFAPIISPQYVLWLLPFAAILAARGDRLVAGFMLAAGGLSTLEFALIGGQIGGMLYATVPVLARNAVLVAMLIAVLLKLGGFIGCGASGIPSPFRREGHDRTSTMESSPGTT